jgi:Fe-S-cluster-containing hydrogenase component 2
MKFDMPTCGGCRTCEMACSYMHTKEFSYLNSRIKIMDDEEGRGFYVWLNDKGDGKVKACDGCKQMEIPYCVQYCKQKDELIEILQQFDLARRGL